MGESLFQIFLRKYIDDVKETLARIGVEGILSEFQFWLLDNLKMLKNELSRMNVLYVQLKSQNKLDRSFWYTDMPGAVFKVSQSSMNDLKKAGIAYDEGQPFEFYTIIDNEYKKPFRNYLIKANDCNIVLYNDEN